MCGTSAFIDRMSNKSVKASSADDISVVINMSSRSSSLSHKWTALLKCFPTVTRELSLFCGTLDLEAANRSFGIAQYRVKTDIGYTLGLRHVTSAAQKNFPSRPELVQVLRDWAWLSSCSQLSAPTTLREGLFSSPKSSGHSRLHVDAMHPLLQPQYEGPCNTGTTRQRIRGTTAKWLSVGVHRN